MAACAHRASARAGARVCRRQAGRSSTRAGSPARRGRRDHAVELPARARDALGRAGARAGQRGRAQAATSNTPVTGGVLIARIFEEAGLPERRAARPLRRRRGRAGARRGPARADDLVHRLDRDGPPGRRGRGPRPQAGRARARRQQPADRARRRRHRGRVVRRGVGLVPAPGPDLPRGQPAPRARVDRRGVPRGAHRAGRAPAGRAIRHRDEVALGPIINEKQIAARAADRRRDGRRGRDGARRRHPRRRCSSRRPCCAT